MINLDFISDPGHGWLKVPLHLLKEYNILSDVSNYSYKDDYYGYLEEDCDAAILIKKLKAMNMPYKIKHHDYNNECFVRRLRRIK